MTPWIEINYVTNRYYWIMGGCKEETCITWIWV